MRDDRAMSQREFAQFLAVGLSTVSAWEQGTRVPRLSTRRLIAEKLRKKGRDDGPERIFTEA